MTVVIWLDHSVFPDYPLRFSLFLLQCKFILSDELFIRSPCYSRCDPITPSHTVEVTFPHSTIPEAVKYPFPQLNRMDLLDPGFSLQWVPDKGLPSDGRKFC